MSTRSSPEALENAHSELQGQLDTIHANRQGMKAKLIALMAQRRSVWEEEFEQDERVWSIERDQQLEAAALRRIELKRLQAKRVALERAAERRELELEAINTLKHQQLEAILMNSSDAAATARADDGWLFDAEGPEDDRDSASSDSGRDDDAGGVDADGTELPTVNDLVTVQSQAAKQLRHFRERCAREQQRAAVAVALSGEREGHTRQLAELAALKHRAELRRQRGIDHLVAIERGDAADDAAAVAVAAGTSALSPTAEEAIEAEHWGALDLAQRVSRWATGGAPEAQIAALHVGLDDARTSFAARGAAWDAESTVARAHWKTEVPAAARSAAIVAAQQERWAAENQRRVLREQAEFSECAAIAIVRAMVEEEVRLAVREAAETAADSGGSTRGLIHDLMLDAVLVATARPAPSGGAAGEGAGESSSAATDVAATRRRLRRRKGLTAALSEMLRQRDAADVRERAGRARWAESCLEAELPRAIDGGAAQRRRVAARGGAARAVPPPYMSVQLEPVLRISLPLRPPLLASGTTVHAQKARAAAANAAAAAKAAEAAERKKRGLFNGLLALGARKKNDTAAENDTDSDSAVDASSDSDGADAEDDAVDVVVALGSVAADPPLTAMLDAERAYWSAIRFVPLAPLAHPHLDVETLVARATRSAKHRRVEREVRAAARAQREWGNATGCATIVEQFLNGRVLSIAAAPCGRLLALGGADGALAVVDVSWCATGAGAWNAGAPSAAMPPPLPLVAVTPRELDAWSARVEGEIVAAKKKATFLGGLGSGLGAGGGVKGEGGDLEDDERDRTVVGIRWSDDSSRVACCCADGHVDVWALDGEAARYGDVVGAEQSSVTAATAKAAATQKRAADAFALLPATDEEEEAALERAELGFLEKQALQRGKRAEAAALKKKARARDKARKQRKKEKKARKAARAKEKLARVKENEKEAVAKLTDGEGGDGHRAESGPTRLNSAEEVAKRVARRAERAARRGAKLAKRAKARREAANPSGGGSAAADNDEGGEAAAGGDSDGGDGDGAARESWEAHASIGLLQRAPPRSVALLLSLGGAGSESLLLAEHDGDMSDGNAASASAARRDSNAPRKAEVAAAEAEKAKQAKLRKKLSPAERAAQRREAAATNPIGVSARGVAFHPSLTLSCAQESIVVGLISGRIVKLNRNAHVPRLYGSILVSQEGSALDIPFASHARGAAAGAGKSKSAKTKALSEHFHAHNAPLLLLDFVARSSLVMVSLDEGTHRTEVTGADAAAKAYAAQAAAKAAKAAEAARFGTDISGNSSSNSITNSSSPIVHTSAHGGYATLLLWKYAASELCGFGWFVPAMRVRLALAVTTLSVDKSVSEKVMFGAGVAMDADAKAAYSESLDEHLASGALLLWFVEASTGASVYGPRNLIDGAHGVGAEGKKSVRFDVVTHARAGGTSVSALASHAVRYYTPGRRYGRVLRAQLTKAGREVVLMTLYPSAPPVHTRAFVRFSTVVLCSIDDRVEDAAAEAAAAAATAARAGGGPQSRGYSEVKGATDTPEAGRIFSERCCAEHGLPPDALISPYVRPWPIDMELHAALSRTVDEALTSAAAVTAPPSTAALRELMPADFELTPVLDATGSDYIYVHGFPSVAAARKHKKQTRDGGGGGGSAGDLDEVMVFSLLTGQRLAQEALRAAAQSARALPRSSSGSGDGGADQWRERSNAAADAAGMSRGLALAKHDLLVTSRGGARSALEICRIVDGNDAASRGAARNQLVEHLGGIDAARRELRLHTAPPEAWVRSANARWDVAEMHVRSELRSIVLSCVDAVMPLAAKRAAARSEAEANAAAVKVEAAVVATAAAKREANALALAKLEVKAAALVAARQAALTDGASASVAPTPAPTPLSMPVRAPARTSTAMPTSTLVAVATPKRVAGPPPIAALAKPALQAPPQAAQQERAPGSTVSLRDGGGEDDDFETDVETETESDDEAELLFRAKLIAFYTAHDAAKLSGVDALARKYAEKQGKLERALYKKYGSKL